MIVRVKRVLLNSKMNDSVFDYLKVLSQAQWLSPDQFRFSNDNALQWLTEQGSLSHKLSAHCDHFAVEVVRNEASVSKGMSADEIVLLDHEACWLREVVLSGDGVPWVIGRTLMSLDAMVRGQYDISQQGTVPIGVTVFSSADTKRDALQVAHISTPQGDLLARRSRLWVAGHPILVAELFLPESPVYNMESNQ
ncbi:chorismate lyase [Vibrio hangzhouensis]|uniref:Probable chorismate pyruvate-lyase n=2 Tax=Vibrio hangzhouensis TaxID=462991 RepID=A0A1H6CDJ3_9VIBR|nr:chorismate lyase [Vibrio hangzhouensis]